MLYYTLFKFFGEVFQVLLNLEVDLDKSFGDQGKDIRLENRSILSNTKEIVCVNYMRVPRIALMRKGFGDNGEEYSAG